jgi:tetratricopeptide (TPR) repeat protein
MSTAVLTTNRLELSSIANRTLRAAVGFWFAVALIGQLALGFTVASFYGLTAVRGDLTRWGRFVSHGYVPGDHMGNLALSMHVLSAAIIMFAGMIQFVPKVRSRFPAFHRWNGRIYMLMAVTLSAAGLYMTWIRGSVGDLSVHLASTANAILIWLFGAIALRYAMVRDFREHRRWALRFFIVVSASWFFRVMFFLSLIVLQRPFGFDPNTFSGPFITFMAFGQFLVPLAVLEIYLRAQDRPGALRRFATAAMLFVLTLATGAGLLAVAGAVWVPQLKAAYDSRKSIAEILSTTIASGGTDAGLRRYRDLKAAAPTTYNFDEEELNNLGYQFLRVKKFKEAIAILQLNVEAYPKSSNVYDSLGEAYMDDENKALAIVNYQKSLDLNPKNGGAAKMLQKLRAQ